MGRSCPHLVQVKITLMVILGAFLAKAPNCFAADLAPPPMPEGAPGANGEENAKSTSQPMGDTAQSVAKQLRNPLSSLREVFFQLDVLPKTGATSSTTWRGSIQPVWPIDLSHDWKMVSYAIVPILSAPGATTDASRVGGLGDIQLFGYIVPPNERGLLWGVGPSVVLPTHTNSTLGTDAWSAGPALIIGGQPGNWSIFGLFSNVWGFAGAQEVSIFDLQYDVSYLLPADWFLMSNWIIEADWTLLGSERWTVPVGAGAGRQFTIGPQLVQAYGQIGYNVVRPTDAATWRGAVTLSLVF